MSRPKLHSHLLGRCFAHGPEAYHSLAAHFDTVFYILLDVKHAALLYEDCFETSTVKRPFAYLPERAGKCDFIDSTVSKTQFSDALYAVWDFDALKILAVIKCLVLESL